MEQNRRITMKQKMWIAVLGITLSLTACGTKAPADQPEIPIQQTEQTEVPTDPSTEVPAVPEAYLEIIAQYQAAIKEQYDRMDGRKEPQCDGFCDRTGRRCHGWL